MSSNRRLAVEKDYASEAAEKLFQAIGTPLALKLSEAISKKAFKEVVTASIDPRDYVDAGDFGDDYLAVEAFSKFPSWDIGEDRQLAALTKFRASELACLETNRRLKRGFGTPSVGVSTASYMYTAARKIARLLGDFSWDEASKYFGFGPGASTRLARSRGDAFYKFSGIPEVTAECAIAGDALVRSVPGWHGHLLCLTHAQSSSDSLVDIAVGNRITTVPKNAKTDRTIAIEPDLNMYLQKGIGGVIRRRLLRVGVTLNNQVRNQLLARVGSIGGNYATIDLASASDSVSLELCRQLLPPSWFAAIELTRSPRGVLPSGEVVTYQKVSSMGNGFTFELESLLFWALCSSVITSHASRYRRLRVYGDDLVVPTQFFPPIVSLLAYCGFETNVKKTFVDGPFRESCGKHYFSGVDVTPFYIRKDFTHQQRILMCNNIRRYAARGRCYGLDSRFRDVYYHVVETLSRYHRVPRIPDGFGDDYLIGDFDECRPQINRPKRGFEGFAVNLVVQVPPLKKVGGVPYLLRQLSSSEQKGGGFVNLSVGERNYQELIHAGRPLPLSSIDDKVGKSTRRMQSLVFPQWVSRGPWF